MKSSGCAGAPLGSGTLCGEATHFKSRPRPGGDAVPQPRPSQRRCERRAGGAGGGHWLRAPAGSAGEAAGPCVSPGLWGPSLEQAGTNPSSQKPAALGSVRMLGEEPCPAGGPEPPLPPPPPPRPRSGPRLAPRRRSLSHSSRCFPFLPRLPLLCPAGPAAGRNSWPVQLLPAWPRAPAVPP